VFQRIIVPLDGTPFGEHALPPAIDLAVRLGARIELVHVHHYTERPGHHTALPQYQFQRAADADNAWDADILTRERRELEERAAELELRYGIEVTARVLIGRTPAAIAEEAGNMVADLVVMASHGRTGVARLRHGSLAQELLSQLNVPTLCVHPPAEDAPPSTHALQRILVPLDGSLFSEQVLDIVAPLATLLGLQVTLLHVVAPRPLLNSGTADGQRVILRRDQAIEYLHEVAERWHGRMPEPVLLALEDVRPAKLIATLLGAGDYDAVTMATHGRGGLSAMLMGSVAADVLCATGAPVLLYRPRIMRLPVEASGRSATASGE
jgi:nucleotide-binding universal stress UspA family protein